MMEPFLKQTARHYYNKGLDNICFIFPNRRSSVFFRKYLSEVLTESAGNGVVSPIAVPDMFTVNDFFSKLYGSGSSDRLTLLIELYGCYKELYPKAESLDEFIFWGDIILADFNDVDKYLADPAGLFANVSDFKAMQDTFEYLTDVQRKAIEGFVSHFNDRSGRLTVDLGSDNPDVKGRFLQIWNILYRLYVDFGNNLREKGLAYEGMVYRGLVGKIEENSVQEVLSGVFGDSKRFVFVGLNALNECEKFLLRKMRDCGVAEFCWDYSGEMIQDRDNKSSFFMSSNVKEFPQAFECDPEGLGIPSFNVASVPSAVGQVKLVPYVLGNIARQKGETCLSEAGSLENAIVLPDESLLMPLLNTLPPEISSVNVTMGYPMTGSAFYSMMSELASMQIHARIRPEGVSFYYKQVWSLFSGSIFRKVMGEEELEKAKSVKKGAKLYIPLSDLSGSGLFDIVFRRVITDQKQADAGQIAGIASYQAEVISYIAPLLADDPDMAVELEFAKEYYRCVNRLKSIELAVLPATYIRILDQLLGSVSVPFKGEPLNGLQIMGPLETRALDFRNVILLSANEGVFPRRSVSSSFIPPELRKGFGLPTYEYQDAVWAYYFYRMVSRAENVWMIYDSRTEGMKSGEESRYIKQLEYHFRIPLKRYAADARFSTVSQESEITKTPEDVALIKEKYLSASSVQNYIACPAKFYYSSVLGLSSEDEVAESMDAAMIGTVYHGVMQSLYTGEAAMSPDVDFDTPEGRRIRPMEKVSRQYIENWAERVPEIKAKVWALMTKELKDKEVSGRNLVTGDVIVRYVLKTLQRDLEHLEERGTDAFRVVGLEKKMFADVGGFKFKGYVDRIDSFAEDEIRVVDYKTGKVLPEDIAVTDENAGKIADTLYGDFPFSKKPKIAFQLFIYDMFLKQKGLSEGKKVFDSVYSTASMFKEMPASEQMGLQFYDRMMEGLEELLAEIGNPDVPFRRTADTDVCGYCDFKVICGR